jgi:hypothetical protein
MMLSHLKSNAFLRMTIFDLIWLNFTVYYAKLMRSMRTTIVVAINSPSILAISKWVNIYVDLISEVLLLIFITFCANMNTATQIAPTTKPTNASINMLPSTLAPGKF